MRVSSVMYFAGPAVTRWCLVSLLLLFCGSGVRSSAAVDVSERPPVLTNLVQLAREATKRVPEIHPFRVVAEVVDVDGARGVLVAKDATGTQFIRLEGVHSNVQAGATVLLEGNGCAVARDRFGISIVPGLVVDHDGVHPMVPQSGTIFLTEGLHPISLDWFNWFGESGLLVQYEGPDIRRQQIPGSVLRRAVVKNSGVTNFSPGLNFRSYEGVWELLPDFEALTHVKSGVAGHFDGSVRSRIDAVGLQFNGYISIQQAGRYTFHLISDDGSRLSVGEPFHRVEVVRAPAGRSDRAASSLPSVAHRSWVTLEGVLSSAGAWALGGEATLRVGEDEIRLEVFESRDFAGVPLGQRVFVTGLYEQVLTESGASVPGRMLVLNWKSIERAEAATTSESQAPKPEKNVVSQQAATNGIPVLRNANEIKSLSLEAANRSIPVSIRGVVTAFLSRHTGAVVQDATGGVFVELNRAGAETLNRGELCLVEGVTGPGLFAPVVVARRITRLGPGEMPEPLVASREQLLNGSLDTKYAEIDGVITSIDQRRITLLTGGDRVLVELVDFQPDALVEFANALVRIRGCFFANFNFNTRKLEAGSLSIRGATIDVLEPAPSGHFDAPRKSIGQLLFYDPYAASFRRLKTSGQVIYSRAGEHFLTDGTNGLHVTTRTPDLLPVGDIVEAVGFLTVRGNIAELKEAMLRKTGHAPLPAAVTVPPDQLLQARHAGTLVEVQATLLNHWRDGSERVLELQSGFLAFSARFQEGNVPMSLPPSGSRLALTGVYAPQGDTTGDGAVSGFVLLLSSPGGVHVLSTPPWWTLTRVLILAGVLAAILFGVLLWNKELHNKVEVRSQQLEAEIRNRQRVELQHAAEAERARIARDLHDELGTGLTEVSLLASAGLGQFHDAQKIRDRFDNIADKARALVSGLDVIVWAIDPKRNSLQSFVDYLANYARELFSSAPIDCRLRIRMEQGAVALSEAERHSLFLAVKETLNNVIRHSSATEVELQISQTGDCLEIAISDNGRGFETNLNYQGNGLGNLRDRLAAMDGRCEIESQPGKGTTVQFIVPIPREAGNHN